MRLKLHKWLIYIGSVSLMFISFKVAAFDAPSDKQAVASIRSIIEQTRKARQSGNVEFLLSIIASDAIFIENGKIKSFNGETWAEGLKWQSQNWSIEIVDLIEPKINLSRDYLTAWVVRKYQFSYAEIAFPEEKTEKFMAEMTIFQNINGQWLIKAVSTHVISSDDAR